MVVWSNNSEVKTPSLGKLSSVLYSIDKDDWWNVSQVSTSRLVSASPFGLLRSVKIDEFTAAVAFVDANMNYALRGVLASVAPSPASQRIVLFGSSYLFSGGATIAEDCGNDAKYGAYCRLFDFELTAFSAEGAPGLSGAAVMFADVGNGNRVTVAAAKVSERLASFDFASLPELSSTHSCPPISSQHFIVTYV